LKYFKKYKKSKETNFFIWLENNTNYIENICDLYNITEMFDLTHMKDYKNYDQLKIINGPVNLSNLKSVMEKEDFIFID